MDSRGVSVIMPVHLRGEDEQEGSMLRRALHSVLNQDCPLPLEILIIDGGSAIHVENLCRKTLGIQSPAIRYFRQDRDLGLVYGLNFGISASKYSLIARIDSDDQWRPGKLKAQLAEFERDPSLSLVATGMRLLHKNPAHDGDYIRPKDWKGIMKFFQKVGCPFPHGSILAKKSIFNILNGYPHDPLYAHCEDFALWGTWLRFFKTTIIQEVFYDYTVSDTQKSSRNKSELIKGSDMVRQHFAVLKDAPAVPQAVEDLAALFGKKLVDMGILLYLAWKYHNVIVTDDNQLRKLLKTVMPDRKIIFLDEVDGELVDRFLYLSPREPVSRTPARLIQTKNDLQKYESLILSGEF